MAFATPILITNFKAYQEAIGAKAVELAKMHERVANEMGVNVAIVGMSLDLEMLAAAVSIPVLAQHMDGVTYGPYTGLIPVDVARSMGIDGSMLNHSERRLSDAQIVAALENMKRLNMMSIVCAENDEEGVRYAGMGADFVAVEVPELIGGNVSVSQARPDVIQRAVAAIGKGKVIVGAGIKTGEDVRKALELGASGVLLSSGVVKAKDPMAALRDLCSGLKHC
jgi:triosephosphate isomerase